MAIKILLSMLVLVYMTGKSAGCRGGRVPNLTTQVHGTADASGLVIGQVGQLVGPRRLLKPTPETMTFGNVRAKSLYAAMVFPMDWETAAAACDFSDMHLISPNQTEDQKELLRSLINNIAEDFEINTSDSSLRFWTSAVNNSSTNLLGAEVEHSEQCGISSVAGNELIRGYVRCSDMVEITICEP